MIVLDDVTKSIVVAMSGAAATTNPDFVAAYSDNDGTTFTEGANDGALNGTSSVTMVAAPASSTRRLIKSLSIENKDTAAVTVTVSYNNNSTLRTLYKVTLAVGDTWTTDGTFDTNGNLKQATTAGVVSFSAGTTGFTPSTASTGVVTLSGTLAVANGGTGVTTSTGSGNTVLSTSPTLVTPVLGTPTSVTLTNATGLPLTTGVTGILAPANGGTGVANNASSTLTISGAYPTTLTVSASTSVTLPTTGTLSTLAGSETFTNKTLTNPTITNYTESVVAIGTVTTASTIALTSGTIQTATLTASTACTFTMPTATAGKSFTLLLKQAASTGNGTATFTGVKWGTAGAPTITATAGKMDILTFVSDGTNWYGNIAQGYTP